MGSDLIIQAKSGTGKTCVFAVTAVDLVMSYLNRQNVKNNVNNNVNNSNNMDGPIGINYSTNTRNCMASK